MWRGEGSLASGVLIVVVLVLLVGCSPALTAPGPEGSPAPGAASPTGPAAAPSVTAALSAQPQPTVIATQPASTAAPAQAAPTPIAEKNVMNATPPPAPIEPSLQPYVLQAQEDLARRTGIPLDQIAVLSAQPVTWPDGSLGCPQPGMAYTQVTVDGLLIRLHAGSREYEYHSGGARAPFLCQK